MRGVYKNRLIIERVQFRHSNYEEIPKMRINHQNLDKIIIHDMQPIHTITSYTYLKSLCCKARLNKIEQDMIYYYLENEKYIDKVIDIVTYIKFFAEFQNLKKILLNDHQISALNLIKPKNSNKEENEEILRNWLVDYLQS